jgi:hypothetical protein
MDEVDPQNVSRGAIRRIATAERKFVTESLRSVEIEFRNERNERLDHHDLTTGIRTSRKAKALNMERGKVGRSKGWVRSLFELIVLICALGWVPGANAQAQQDPVAISALQTALIAMGGSATFNAIQDATVSGQAEDSNGQPISPLITWQSIGIAIRSQVTSSAGTTINAAQNGVGYIESPSGSVSAMDTRTANSMFPPDLPGVMLNYLLNAPNCSLAIISDSNGNPSVIHVQAVMLASDQTPITETQQDWYIDTTTGLPTQVIYVIPNASGPDGTGTFQFTSWQKTPTVLIPQTIQMSLNAGSPTAIVLAAPSFNQGLSTSIFQLP